MKPDSKMVVEENGQRSIFLSPGRSAEPVRHFFLEKEDTPRKKGPVRKYFKKEGGGDGVGQIACHFDFPGQLKSLKSNAQNISFDYCQVGHTSFFDERDESPILFDGNDVTCSLGKRESQLPFSRTDFKDGFTGMRIDDFYDSVENAAVF